ncbi:unnamed protein product [Mytilus coruscus]|uniref:C-type lectin domain-containing protein n=1 Tax=Mytilus coruscus TaxID=42192 RepID=A0A6J7ZWQ4_MYTCO|nr:unnamed protein product [Mytilus coruscus]
MFDYTLLGIILLGTFTKLFSSILTCSEGWNLHGSKCYKLDPEMRNFTNSKKFCENLNAEMIMPKTAEENSILSEIGKWFWIGLMDHDKTIALDWTWNDGSKLESKDRWSNGEPNNNDSPEECVISGPNGWADVPCTGIKTTACQTKPDIIADEDESVTLTCDVKYKENITKLFWTRSTDDTSLIVSEYAKGGNIILPSLVFEHVKWTDEGLYKCHVIFISGLTLTDETNLFINATNMLPCTCEYRRKLEYWGFKIIPNRTREELLQELKSELQKIKKELKVNKRQLSSSIRKRTSATDRRKSSKTMGLAGTAVICIVVGLVILIDLLSLVKFVKSTITFWNFKKIRQKAKDKKSKMRKKFDINKKKTQTSESSA